MSFETAITSVISAGRMQSVKSRLMALQYTSKPHWHSGTTGAFQREIQRISVQKIGEFKKIYDLSTSLHNGFIEGSFSISVNATLVDGNGQHIGYDSSITSQIHARAVGRISDEDAISVDPDDGTGPGESLESILASARRKGE